MAWAKESAMAGPRLVACHLLTAAVVRPRQAAVVRLWFQEQSASAPDQAQAMLWAKAWAMAGPRRVACHLLTAKVRRRPQRGLAWLWLEDHAPSAPAQPQSTLQEMRA